MEAAVSKKKVSLKAVPVKAMPTPSPIVEAEKLRDDTRAAYSRFQRSWFEFAKAVTLVHDTKVWRDLGYDTFKEYSVEEFKDFDYSMILKFVKVIQGYFGKAIEARIKKNPEGLLPVWSTCYHLTVAENNFPREMVPKLRKDVLEGKITREEMLSKVKEYSTRVDPAPDSEEIDKEIEGATKVETIDAEVVDDDQDIVKEMIVHARALGENLPKLAKIEKASAESVKLAEVLYEEVIDAANDYINHLEDLSSEDK